MKKKFIFLFATFILFVLAFKVGLFAQLTTNGAPPYVVEDLNPPDINEYAWLDNWKRPDGPPKVGLQAGHWKNGEIPEELLRLSGSTGASGGGKSEWEVNLKIAEYTKKLLEEKGITVEIIPATVPAEFWADVFVSIHADGSIDTGTSGFKAASPRRDFSGKAQKLVSVIEENYAAATNLELDPNVTRNMRGYYAFAWWRYKHAVHPKTPAVILETGFLTNPSDRNLLVNRTDTVAMGLASGIISFLQSEKLL